MQESAQEPVKERVGQADCTKNADYETAGEGEARRSEEPSDVDRVEVRERALDELPARELGLRHAVGVLVREGCGSLATGRSQAESDRGI